MKEFDRFRNFLWMTHAEIIRLHHWISKFQVLKPRCVCITYERNAAILALPKHRKFLIWDRSKTCNTKSATSHKLTDVTRRGTTNCVAIVIFQNYIYCEFGISLGISFSWRSSLCRFSCPRPCLSLHRFCFV